MTDTPTPVDLTLVIACYNEEPILEASVAETLQVLDNLKRTFEIVFVDDASQDGTRGIIDEIIRTHPNHRLRKIEHAGNIGRGGTVTDGIRIAAAPVVGFIDIDLEVRAGYILPCLLAIDRGYDVATALRIYKFSVRSLNRYVMSRGYRWLMRKVLRVPLNDTETGFKFFRRDAVLPILDRTEDRGWFWDTEIMVRAHHAGLTIIEIPALFIRRFDKQSSLHPFADTLDYARKLWRFRQTARALGSQIR